LSIESRCTQYIFSRLIPAVSPACKQLRSEIRAKLFGVSDPGHCIEKRKKNEGMLVCIVHGAAVLINL
jgi:hypothetical protein